MSGAVEQGSAEWLAQRVGKFGGTAVGVLEGCNPYQKPSDLVRSMVRDLAGAPSEFEMVPAVEHGQAMEPVAKAWYEKTFNTKVDETDFVVHSMYPFLGASPDGLVGLDGAIEIKCPYPRYTKAPYSVFDEKKKMYLRQCQMVMEVLDVDWIDFLCYLSPHAEAHPEYNIERLHREDGWLHEELSGQLLPTPRSGRVPRIDLYAEWHEYVMREYNDPSRRKVHVDAAADMYEVITNDDVFSQLSRAMKRMAEIESEIQDQLAERQSCHKEVEDLKKILADKYNRNVTDGTSMIQVIQRRPSMDYRRAFEALGGESSLLANGLTIDAFRSASNTRQIKVKLGE